MDIANIEKVEALANAAEAVFNDPDSDWDLVGTDGAHVVEAFQAVCSTRRFLALYGVVRAAISVRAEAYGPSKALRYLDNQLDRLDELDKLIVYEVNTKNPEGLNFQDPKKIDSDEIDSDELDSLIMLNQYRGANGGGDNLCRDSAAVLLKLRNNLKSTGSARDEAFNQLRELVDRDNDRQQYLFHLEGAFEKKKTEVVRLCEENERLHQHCKQLNKELWTLKWDWIDATGHLVLQPVKAGTDLSRVLAANAQFCTQRDDALKEVKTLRDENERLKQERKPETEEENKDPQVDSWSGRLNAMHSRAKLAESKLEEWKAEAINRRTEVTHLRTINEKLKLDSEISARMTQTTLEKLIEAKDHIVAVETARNNATQDAVILSDALQQAGDALDYEGCLRVIRRALANGIAMRYHRLQDDTTDKKGSV